MCRNTTIFRYTPLWCLGFLTFHTVIDGQEVQPNPSATNGQVKVIFNLEGDLAPKTEGLRIQVGPDLKLYAGRGIILEGDSLTVALKRRKNAERVVMSVYLSKA